MPSDKIKVFKLQRLEMSKPTLYLIGEETDIPQKRYFNSQQEAVEPRARAFQAVVLHTNVLCLLHQPPVTTLPN